MAETVKKPPIESIFPYFQPIVAADTGKAYAYEVLGRYVDNGEVKSMGPFFSKAAGDKALEVDRIIRRLALKKFADENSGEYLFINIRLNWIARYADRPQDLPTIKWAEEFGIDPRRLVIEITEEEFLDENQSFSKALAHYKSVGCRIAIDDFGTASSQIDRLALVAPDILKIDKMIIHRSEKSLYYREYLRVLTSFAEKVGIEVLYEGIETERQLDICVASKGRFYQGFHIAMPQPSIRGAVINQDAPLMSIDRNIASLRDKSVKINTRHELWDARIERFIQENGIFFETDKIDEYLSKLGLCLTALAKKVYICDNQGNQLSQNIEVSSENIRIQNYRNRNWAWRGFFQDAVTALDNGAKSYMTNTYRDVTTKEKIQTYIYRMHFNMYLFIDITNVS